MRVIISLLFVLIIISSGCVSDTVQKETYRVPQINSTTSSYFSVSPTSVVAITGNNIEFTSDILNKVDADDHSFVINVIPFSSSRHVCVSGNLDACDSPIENTSLYEFINNWIIQNETALPINSNESGHIQFNISLPEKAQSAHYIFNVYCCYDRDGIIQDNENCNEDSDNLYSNQATFLIEIDSEPLLFCMNDSDCVMVWEPCCGNATSINNKFYDQWLMDYAKACEGIGCGGPAPPKRLVPKCINNRCTLV